MSVSRIRPPWVVSLALVVAAVLKVQAADGPLSSSAVIQAVSSAMQASGSTGPFISPEFGLDDPLLRHAWNGQFVPVVAFNGTNYLVVWSDERNAPDSDRDIYGARVTTDGVVLDTNGFPICAAAWEQAVPAVAASGGEFLVTWNDRRSGSGAIYAANVTAEGTVRQPDGVFIQSFTGTYVKVAANGTGFLLVWHNYSALTAYDILGAKLSNIVNPGVSAFVISALPGWEHSPDVAASGSDYLVVWQDNRNSTGDPQDIYGARVNANGDVLDPNGFAIATGSWDQSAPAVAGNGSNYLVVQHGVTSQPLTLTRDAHPAKTRLRYGTTFANRARRCVASSHRTRQ